MDVDWNFKWLLVKDLYRIITAPFLFWPKKTSWLSNSVMCKRIIWGWRCVMKQVLRTILLFFHHYLLITQYVWKYNIYINVQYPCWNKGLKEAIISLVKIFGQSNTHSIYFSKFFFWFRFDQKRHHGYQILWCAKE